MFNPLLTPLPLLLLSSSVHCDMEKAWAAELQPSPTYFSDQKPYFKELVGSKEWLLLCWLPSVWESSRVNSMRNPHQILRSGIPVRGAGPEGDWSSETVPPTHSPDWAATGSKWEALSHCSCLLLPCCFISLPDQTRREVYKF